MTRAAKLEIVLRSEDNCRWVRERLFELQLHEEGISDGAEVRA